MNTNNKTSKCICGAVADNKCSACPLAWYCSAQCQRNDWPAHKPICSQAKLCAASNIDLHAIGKQIKPVEADRANFLTSKPYWSADHSLLNARLRSLVPGSHLVAPHYEMPPSHKILDKGQFFDGAKAIATPMAKSECHNNVAALKAIGHARGFEGYALTADGLWRPHSWGLNAKGRVLETTMSRLIYLGVEF
jgi:hypothetical protein